MKKQNSIPCDEICKIFKFYSWKGQNIRWKLKCHEYYFDRYETYNKLTIFIFRLDMCRRSHANDVCNRGTAGNFFTNEIFRNSKKNCFFNLNVFIIVLFIFTIFFPWMWTFFTIFPSIQHQNQFLFPFYTPKQIFFLSLYSLCFAFVYFTYTHSAILSFISTKAFFIHNPHLGENEKKFPVL